MLKHIVMWNIKENIDKGETAKQIKVLLEGLKEKIVEIVEIEVGINYNDSEAAHDVVLISTFEKQEDLESYIVNPHHKEAGKYVSTVVKDRVVVDYEV